MLASIIGVTAMWTRGSAADLDPKYWVHGTMLLTAATMVAFAFATGSVLRVGKKMWYRIQKEGV